MENNTPQHQIATIAASGGISVRPIDLKTFDDGPRALDLDIAQRLGFTRPRDIRKLVERNKAELERFGTCATVARVVRGNNVTEYWLNEEQSLLIATLSDAEFAANVRHMLIKVFVAWRRGQLQPATEVSGFREAREIRLQFRHHMGLAKLMGLTGNQLLIAANEATKKASGHDTIEAMGVKHLIAPQQEALFIPSDIGERLGMSSVAVNHLLAEHGFQEGGRDSKGRNFWQPTEKGIKAGGVMVDVARGNGTGTSRQLKWASGIVDVLQSLVDGEIA